MERGKKLYVSWQEFDEMTRELVRKISDSNERFSGIYAPPRGGLVLAVCLSHALKLDMTMHATPDSLIVDDISDSGKCLEGCIPRYEANKKRPKIACLFSTQWTTVVPDWYIRMKETRDNYIIFPWENITGAEN